MTMWRFALSTVRARAAAYIASACVISAGTALLTAFAALVETGIAVPDGGGDSLGILAAIMGGWTVVVVVFGIASTITLVVQQRNRELALIRLIGAVPEQVRTMVLVETSAVALPAVVLGLVPGIGLGAFLLDRMVAVGVVDEPVRLAVSAATVAAGALISLLSAMVAAVFAGRRAGMVAPVLALADASGAATGGVSRAKSFAGVAFLLIGIGSGAGTLFASDGPLLAAVAGPACIAVAIGAALLSPLIVGSLGRIANLVPSSVGRLAVRNLCARASDATTVVGALTLLVGVATGTLYMQSTEDSIAGRVPDAIGPQFAAANYLVVAMIIAFSSIAVSNSLIAATWQRRREFGLLQSTSASRPQVLGMVAIENAVAAAIAMVLGTIAAAATIVPYSIVKTGSPIPGGPWWMYPAIVAAGFAVALTATSVTGVRATRMRPVLALTTP
ncbi:FtsX-like permease family protein [Nocardia sp. NBC_01329]|uniref:FtsX-like permease family protein n=1 Tax=Nocardia sp. NBC_01329 TaxID=2903594 RepID=UPI002E119C9B|nr:FtsX-like permease family protein [Nocardia sp. NBC_01329]